VNLEDMARDCEEPSLRTIAQESGGVFTSCPSSWCLLLAERRRVHIGDPPPVGTEVQLGGLTCRNLVRGRGMYVKGANLRFCLKEGP